MTGWRSRLASLSWQRVLPVVVCIVLGLPLLFAGVELRKAGISGFVEADYVEIETKQACVSADLSARNLRLEHLTSLKLPDGRVLTGQGLVLAVRDDDRDGSHTSIPYFSIPAGSQVALAVDRRERRLTIEIQAKELQLRLIPLPGTPVQIDGEACTPGSCDVVFQGGSFEATAKGVDRLVLRMDLDSAPLTVADRVAVSSVKLWEPQNLEDVHERRGAVKSGSFRLLEAPDQGITLEPGSVVDFEPADLIVRGLEVRGESVYLQLSGRVKKLSLEIGDARRSLMPTIFDWLSRNRIVQAAVGIITLLLGGGLTVIQSLARRSPASAERDEVS